VATSSGLGDRLGHYLSSNKNLVGMALAVVGPVLAITGAVAAPIGLAIGVPLYLVGALAVPSRHDNRPLVIGGFDGGHILDKLSDVERQVHGKVHASVEERVHRIATTIRETLPRADALGPGSAQAHTLAQTATDYLPEALGAYLKLPRTYAEHQQVVDGKTPLQVLCDQLDLLAAKMDEVFTAVCQSDADALVAHGRFLSDKFAPGSLDLGAGPDSQPATRPSAPPPPAPAVSMLQPPTPPAPSAPPST
jgi:hypothetical protein